MLELPNKLVRVVGIALCKRGEAGAQRRELRRPQLRVSRDPTQPHRTPRRVAVWRVFEPSHIMLSLLE